MAAPVRLKPRPIDGPARFEAGRSRPRAIAWFGFSAFWGHLRHLLATAIATDNVDSRQWMHPDRPEELLGRVREALCGRGAKEGATLVEALGGEAWLDFVADTGDDRDVSEAVAKLIAGEYVIDDPNGEGDLVLPRGDILVLGGDLAYPVATVREMSRRLLEPWNRVLERADDGARPRVLLGVPGNHDWYDGLDGFARLCQLPADFEAPPRTVEETLFPETNQHPVLAWMLAFSRGEVVKKPRALALFGYVPVQRASYFRLPLARDLELLGVDRQLGEIDPRQRAFFASRQARSGLVILPDPARAWGELRPDGVRSVDALGLRLSEEAHYVLSGDIHHYERSNEGPSVHVVAGGGGAFLHGARIAKGGAYERVAEFPGPAASSRMLWSLPWHVATGGAGWLLWGYFAFLQGIEFWVHYHFGSAWSWPLALAHSLVITLATAMLVGWGRHRRTTLVAFSAILGTFIGAFPLGVALVTDALGFERVVGVTVDILLAWLLSTLASCAAFGLMLALLARWGLNHAQPYAALGSPSHKHVVRMRIREDSDGAIVDTFVVGVVDPVGQSPPVLVDAFRWRP